MRFFEDGPAIPDTLLEQSDAGNVVFFCGAGVSCYPGAQGQSMPTFKKLTEEVVTRLSPSPKSKAGKWIENGGNDPNTSSIDVFDDLKDPDHFGEEIVNLEVADILNSKRIKGRNLTQHRHISQISKTKNGHPRVVTTNFDVLFEKAMKDIKMEIHLPPIKMNSSSNLLRSGITYLHGRVPEITDHVPDGRSLKTNLILSTSDFGAEYHWDGWATEFTRSLFSNYTIVFIGYSAGDMPIHYMLSGMKISRDSDQQNLYVFDRGEFEDLSQKWKGRGVQPIPYSNRDVLWKTIEAWAERSKNPAEWKSYPLRMAQADPRTLKPHERGQVVHVSRTVDGMKLFSELNPAAHPRWLNVLDSSIRLGRSIFGSHPQEFDYVPQDEYGLDDEPSHVEVIDPGNKPIRRLRPTHFDQYLDNINRRNASQGANKKTERKLQKCNETWICKHLDSPVMAWWIARQPHVSPSLLNSLRSQLDKSGDLNQKARLMWKLILDGRSKALKVELNDPWVSFCIYAKQHGWTDLTFEVFKVAATPTLRATSEYDISRFTPPDGGWDTLAAKKIANLEVKFPDRYTTSFEIDDNALPFVIKIFQDNLMLASKLRTDIQNLYGGMIESPTCYQNRCVSGEIQYMEFNSEIVMFLEIFESLIKLNPAAAKDIAEKWTFSERYFFRKLKLFALNHNSLFDIDEVAYWVGQLSEEEFWCENNRRELLFLLGDRWDEFSRQQRQHIIDRLLSPPYSLVDQGEDESDDSARFRAATYGCWLASQKCEFPEKSMKQLNGIVESVSDWKESYVRDTAMICGPMYIRGAPVQSSQVSWNDNSKEFVNVGSIGEFDNLIEYDIKNALLELANAKKENLYPINHWKSLIDKWPANAPAPLSKEFMKHLTNLPHNVLCELKYHLGPYLKRKNASMICVSPRLAWSVFDCCILAWTEDIDASGEPYEDDDILYAESDRDSKRTYGYAIQKPVGMATLFLMNVLMNNPSKIPNEVKRRLNKMLKSTSELRHQCVSIMTQHIAVLFHADQNWTEKNLFPLFEYEQELEEAALSGLASSCFLINVDAFSILKHLVLKIYPRVYEFSWSKFDHGRLTYLMIAAATIYFDNLDRRERLELTDCFRLMKEGDRLNSISNLQNIGNGEEDGWVNYVVPFFKSTWPKDQRFLNEETTKSLVALLSNTDSHFSDVFAALRRFLVSIGDDAHAVFQLAINGGREGGYISAFPSETLDLLDILISPETERPPLLLGKILSLVSRTDESLKRDPRYKRLHRLAKNVDSRHNLA